MVFGALGVFWAAGFYLWFRDEPGEHPAVNAAELQLICAGRSLTEETQHHPPKGASLPGNGARKES